MARRISSVIIYVFWSFIVVVYPCWILLVWTFFMERP